MRIDELKRLTGPEGFAEIDLAFGDFLIRLAGGDSAPPELFAAGALASRAVRAGHSGCDLARLAGGELTDGDPEHPPVRLPAAADFLAVLASDRCRNAVSRQPGEPADKPLVLEADGRVCFQRYFRFEADVAREIRRRSAVPACPPELPAGRLAALSDFFARPPRSGSADYQQLAVFAGLANHFTVVTGGPGTGKTTVVAAWLALELERNPELTVQLAAPTGKAQARLQQSLREGAASLHLTPETADRLRQLPCSTIHALLRPIPGTHAFRHHRDNPLPCDLLVVDECSMVPLALLARLLPALKPAARLLLLGDRHQLASVEAGAALADLCDAGEPNRLPAAVAAAFTRQTGQVVKAFGTAADRRPLTGQVVELTENHRFAAAPNLAAAAAAIRLLTPATLPALAERLAGCREPDFCCLDPVGRRLENRLDALLARPRVDGFAYRDLGRLGRAGGAGNLEKGFALLHSFQILASQHGGPRGVEALNDLVRDRLGLHRPYAPGLPLLITRNDRRTGLFNGDVGLVWKDPGGDIRVFFPEHPRGFLPAELPEHTPVFAMTVHKAQGSGFTEVVLLLPEAGRPGLTRELLYTGLTRAERRVELWAAPAAIRQALENPTRRESGLLRRLTEPANLFETERNPG